MGEHVVGFGVAVGGVGAPDQVAACWCCRRGSSAWCGGVGVEQGVVDGGVVGYALYAESGIVDR